MKKLTKKTSTQNVDGIEYLIGHGGDVVHIKSPLWKQPIYIPDYQYENDPQGSIRAAVTERRGAK